ncbi:MAG: phospholipid carrier-dependent glycosyltransferase, partial [bacterium]
GIRFFGFNPLGYRVMDALFGIGVIVLIYLLGKRLFNSKSVGFLAGLFACLDGLLLVESRAGLINIFAVFFSLAAYYLLLKSGFDKLEKPRWVYLAGAGICIGATAAVKWIGAASLGMILILYGLAWIKNRWPHLPNLLAEHSLLQRIGKINPGLIFVCCILLPVLVYSMTFIPHLQQIPEYSFLELHKQMFGYHAHLQEQHGYASSWWSWPLLLRPVSYYWHVDEPTQQVTTILNIGNPVLWWLAIPAVLFAVWVAFVRRDFGAQFAVLAIALHYLPFAVISRATFLYHFMGALPFTILLLAFVIHKLWSANRLGRELAATAVLAIVLCAIYFLPVWMGLPIPLGAFYQRMWLLSWI